LIAPFGSRGLPDSEAHRFGIRLGMFVIAVPMPENNCPVNLTDCPTDSTGPYLTVSGTSGGSVWLMPMAATWVGGAVGAFTGCLDAAISLIVLVVLTPLCSYVIEASPGLVARMVLSRSW